MHSLFDVVTLCLEVATESHEMAAEGTALFPLSNLAMHYKPKSMLTSRHVYVSDRILPDAPVRDVHNPGLRMMQPLASSLMAISRSLGLHQTQQGLAAIAAQHDTCAVLQF